MANNKNLSIQEADDQVRSAERQLAEARIRKRRRCFHNHISNAHLIPIEESRLPEREKQKYSKTTVVCDNCGDIFETNAFTEDEVDKLFFDLHSILAQIQLINGAKLTENQKAELESAFDKADYLEGIMGSFYAEMIKLMSKGEHKGGKKKTSKGGIGISSGMMR